MAGIRHHILPRFLLRGFKSKTIYGKVFAWVYSKKHSHREMSTKDITLSEEYLAILLSLTEETSGQTHTFLNKGYLCG
jgi:hypothetical protein